MDSVFEEAKAILTSAQDEYKPVKTFVMFSGGNDSTVLLHWAWNTGLVDGAVHLNTGIGIEDTRRFVREFCAQEEIPLQERHPPDRSYEELVMEYGFPGPSMHRAMYQQLKERSVRGLVRETKTHRMDKVMLVTGLRQSESSRRMYNRQAVDRIGAQVWVNPLFTASKGDLAAYRREHQVSENLVSAVLHMSGECLCGAFAHPGELDEIAAWYPEAAAHIRAIESRAREAGVKRCAWGAGGKAPSVPTGPLCSDCDLRVVELA